MDTIDKGILEVLKDGIIDLVNSNGLLPTTLFLISIGLIIIFFIFGIKIIPLLVQKIFKKETQKKLPCADELKTVKEYLSSLNSKIKDISNLLYEYLRRITNSVDIDRYTKIVKVLLGTSSNYLDELKNQLYTYIEIGQPEKQFFKIENSIKDFFKNFVINFIKEFILDDSSFIKKITKETEPIIETFIDNIKKCIEINKEDNADLREELEILIDNFLKDLESTFITVYTQIILEDSKLNYIKSKEC